MSNRFLKSVEQTTLLLAAVAIGIALLALDRRTGFGVTVGAVLMTLNASALRRIAERVKTFKPGATILLFNVKMVLLVTVIFALIHFLHIDGVGLVIGLSILPLAIVIAAVRNALATEAPPTTDGPTGPNEDNATHG